MTFDMEIPYYKPKTRHCDNTVYHRPSYLESTKFDYGDIVKYPAGSLTYVFMGFDPWGNKVIISTSTFSRYVTKRPLHLVRTAKQELRRRSLI